MSLLRIYGLDEARERMLTRQQIEKWQPGILVSFDRDVGHLGGSATFFIDSETDEIYANTKGHGWWILRDEGILGPDGDGMGRWEPVRKPARERGLGHLWNNSVQVTIEMIVGDDEDFTWANLRGSGIQNNVRVFDAGATPNGYRDVRLVGSLKSIVRMLRSLGWDDDVIYDNIVVGGEITADDLAAAGLQIDGE